MSTNAIIAMGLGSNAADMILADFSLSTKFISIVVTAPGAGGGPYPIATSQQGFYTPAHKPMTDATRLVTISVKFSEDKTWKKYYVVDEERADIIIKVIGWLNTFKQRFGIGISAVKRTGQKVLALFKTDDK